MDGASDLTTKLCSKAGRFVSEDLVTEYPSKYQLWNNLDFVLVPHSFHAQQMVPWTSCPQFTLPTAMLSAGATPGAQPWSVSSQVAGRWSPWRPPLAGGWWGPGCPFSTCDTLWGPLVSSTLRQAFPMFAKYQPWHLNNNKKNWSSWAWGMAESRH